MKTKKAAMVKKVSEKSKVKKPVKKRKLTQRQLNEMSETISFVIKGKLTPINPVVNQSKFKKQKRQSLRVIELQQAGLPNKTKNKEPSNRKNKPIKEEANVGGESTTLVKEEGSKKRVTTKKIREPTIVPNKAKNPKASRSKKVKPVTNSLVKVKNQSKTSPKRQKCNIKQEPVETEEDKKHPEKVEIKKTTKPAKPKSALPTPRKVIKKPIKRIKKEAEVAEEKPELVNIKTENLPSHINDLSPDETSTNSDEITLNLLRQQNIEKKPEEIKREPEEKVEKSPAVKKSPVKNKQVILRKKIITNTKDKIKRKGDQRRKMKLFALWNGPKRHRVASLNALAKVHCLYENEGRGSIFDNIQPIKRESSEKKDKEKKEKVERKEKVEKAEKKEKVEKKEKEKVEKSDKVEETVEIVNEEPNVPARNLRTAPGLRGMGKHWDMHDTTSSSEDTGCESSTEVQEVKTKKEPPKKAETERKPPVKRRKRTEIIMDLKDMVVRKRMASLNASAILAASYSLEKNASRSPKSSSDSDSDSDAFSDDSEKKKYEDDVKKEDKLIEVRATPNKKVAVILNQDTDVTITGVYVNSTTRSTHHEGYCSIAGMQYRISATSHTQTAATAVATETLLQSASSSSQENSNGESTPSKSYTPLDALSNMQPPSGPASQHGVQLPHHHLGPPHISPQLSPLPRRHGCSSAFSAPPGHYPSTHHHPPPPPPALHGEQGYMHGNIWQTFLSRMRPRKKNTSKR